MNIETQLSLLEEISALLEKINTLKKEIADLKEESPPTINSRQYPFWLN